MCDAIVFSNWDFLANGSPERIARGLAMHGKKVLYCRNPLSYFKEGRSRVSSVNENLYMFHPRFFGVRLGRISWFARYQQRHLAHCILAESRKLGSKIPTFLYHDVSPFGGQQLLTTFKEYGCRLIHLNLDYTDKEMNAELADRVFSIPKASFQRLTDTFGSKVYRLPQLGPVDYEYSEVIAEPVSDVIKKVPKPWLLYLGMPSSRLDFQLLHAVLERNPHWNFLHSGHSAFLDLPNCHPLPWMNVSQMNGLLQVTDVGLLPYDCNDEMQLNCVPLKLFDYFLHGIPVVSTPIRCTDELDDMVYQASDVDSMERSITSALGELSDNEIRFRRKAFARMHNLFALTENILI